MEKKYIVPAIKIKCLDAEWNYLQVLSEHIGPGDGDIYGPGDIDFEENS